MTIDPSDDHEPADLEAPQEGTREASRSPPVGDGFDAEPLLTAEDVGIILQVPTKSVYELPIPEVRISKRRVRYRPEDVEEFIESRASDT